jgi:hypothetical protein
MIPKSGYRFSDKIMRQKGAPPAHASPMVAQPENP